ncbi:hypothetical protein KXJ81_06220 [Ensifer adhaerens]|uniref:hypothetical protein n=1 Tax=Ensifer adhaerens TaxID=106592 RepID=UPI001C4E2A9D|nr:hypothetical protein [Ensifer adhaerens]MBW0365839.1 hypothetical protein [Ensifer adhaerens]
MSIQLPDLSSQIDAIVDRRVNNLRAAALVGAGAIISVLAVTCVAWQRAEIVRLFGSPAEMTLLSVGLVLAGLLLTAGVAICLWKSKRLRDWLSRRQVNALFQKYGKSAKHGSVFDLAKDLKNRPGSTNPDVKAIQDATEQKPIWGFFLGATFAVQAIATFFAFAFLLAYFSSDRSIELDAPPTVTGECRTGDSNDNRCAPEAFNRWMLFAQQAQYAIGATFYLSENSNRLGEDPPSTIRKLGYLVSSLIKLSQFRDVLGDKRSSVETAGDSLQRALSKVDEANRALKEEALKVEISAEQILEEISSQIANSDLSDRVNRINVSSFDADVDSCVNYSAGGCVSQPSLEIQALYSDLATLEKRPAFMGNLKKVADSLQETLLKAKTVSASLPPMIAELEPSNLGPARKALHDKMNGFFEYFDCLYRLEPASGGKSVPTSCNLDGEVSEARRDEYRLHRAFLIKICTDAAEKQVEICGGKSGESDLSVNSKEAEKGDTRQEDQNKENQDIQDTQATQGNQGTEGIQENQGNPQNQRGQATQGSQGAQGAQGNQGTEGTQENPQNQRGQATQGNQGTQGTKGNQANKNAKGGDGNQSTPFDQSNGVGQANNRAPDFKTEFVSPGSTLPQVTFHDRGGLHNPEKSEGVTPYAIPEFQDPATPGDENPSEKPPVDIGGAEGKVDNTTGNGSVVPPN